LSQLQNKKRMLFQQKLRER